MAIAEKTDGKYVADEDDVMIKKQKGKSMDDSELVRGIILDKKRVSEGMPKKVTGANVALIATPHGDHKYPGEVEDKNYDRRSTLCIVPTGAGHFKEMADSVINAGANVVLCQKGIADPSSSTLQRTACMPLRTFLKRI